MSEEEKEELLEEIDKKIQQLHNGIIEALRPFVYGDEAEKADESTITPGKWRVRTVCYGRDAIGSCEEIYTRRGDRIALAYDPNRIINARAIAALPELIDAMVAFIDVTDTVSRAGADSFVRLNIWNEFSNMKDALRTAGVKLDK